MAEIHVLPNVERRDLAGPPELDGRRILECAIEAGVTDVVVIGRDRAGELYVATSMGDADRAVGVMMRGVSFLTTRSISNDVVFDTEEPA